MFKIVAVCTANICRSPLMELLLRRHLDAQRFEVASVGVYGFDRQPMDADSQRQAQRLGVDPRDFRSRAISDADIDGAGLVLTAARLHRSSLLELAPALLPCTFTLQEFAALAPQADGQTPAEVVRDAARKRSQISLEPNDFDIADPYRAPYEVHAMVANQIFRSVNMIADRLNATG